MNQAEKTKLLEDFRDGKKSRFSCTDSELEEVGLDPYGDEDEWANEAEAILEEGVVK